MRTGHGGFTRADVEVLGREIVYQGFSRMERCRLRHRLFAGGWSEPFARELNVRPRVGAALPYDPCLDQVVLVEQFRAGALEAEGGPWQLEVVAGLLDRDQPLEEMVRRELREEANLTAKRLIPIYDYWSSPGGSTERIQLYCAIVDAAGAGGVHGVPHEHEDIRVCVREARQAFDDVKSGRINNALTLIALQWLALNHRDLRRNEP